MFQNIDFQSRKCEFCEENAVKATHGCRQCKACFCTNCWLQYHSRGPFRKHDALTTDEYLSEGGRVCPDHNEALKLFCESCMESLCCEYKVLGRHADHTVVHLQEYATKLKDDIHKLLIDISQQGLEGESKGDIDVTVGVKKILNNVEKSFARRKKHTDSDMQDLIGELGKVWTAINEEYDKEHSFIKRTLNSALDHWKKMNTDAGSLRKQQQIVSGLKVIKHRMIQSGSDPCTSQSDTSPLSVPFHDCIWHIPRESTEAFEPVCWNSSLSRGSSDLDVNTRIVNVCGMEEYSDTSQEELRLEDYILGRVYVKAVSVLPQWLSLLKRSTSKSPSTLHVDGHLSAFEPSAMVQSLSKSSFVTTVEKTNEASSLFATKPTGTEKCQASSATSESFSSLKVSFPTTLTTKSVIKTPGFTVAVSNPRPSGTDSFVFGSTPAQRQPSSVGFSFGSTTSSSPAFDMLKSVVGKSRGEETDGRSSDKAPNNVFGGFSFKSIPTIQETKQPMKPEESRPQDAADLATKLPNPFANFSFGALKSSPDSQQPPAATTSTKQPLFGSGAGISGPTFASLASSNQPADFSSQSGSSQGFVAGKPLFQNQSPPVKDRSSDHIEEFEPELYFKPLVSLPEVTDHKTGEEDETKLFGHRAKLFRHDTETKQWKERGVGEIKILRNETTGRCRILMRRKQVLKLCANHTITKDMKLAPLASSDKAWCWFAQDYSEEEMKTEQLAAKFKTQDLALKFKEAFEKSQATLAEQKSEVSSTTVPDPEAPVTLKVHPSLAEQFKPKEGEWDCSGCYVRNKPGTEKCVACMTLKDPPPHHPPASMLPPVNSVALPTFQLQPRQQSLADLFAAKEGEWECDLCLIRNKPEAVKCVACETPNPGASDQTGVSPTTTSAGLGGGLKFDSTNEPSAPSSTITMSSGGGFSFGSSNNASEGSFMGCFAQKPVAKETEISSTSGGFTLAQTRGSKQNFGGPFSSHQKHQPSTTTTFQLQPGQQSLADLFAAKEGEWECDVCLVRNKPEAVKCVACEAPNPIASNQAGVSSTTRSAGLGGGLKRGFTDKPSALSSTMPVNSSGGITFFSSNKVCGMGCFAQKTDDDEYETEEDEEEDTDEVLFRKRVTLNYMVDKKPKMAGMGEMLLVVDDDVDGAARVKVTSDKGKLLCNHVICQQHTLAKSRKHPFCEWTAKDFSTDEAVRRTFRAYFSSDAAATEFSEVFKKAVDTARELDISELQDGASVSGEITVPEVVSSPPAAQYDADQ